MLRLLLRFRGFRIFRRSIRFFRSCSGIADLRRCRSRTDLLQTARRLGYRVTHNDLRQAWLQHLQAAEAQELSQLERATGKRR